MGHALAYQGGISADKVDADVLRGPVQGPGDGHKVLRLSACRGAHQSDGGHRHALVDDGHAEISGDGFSGLHQLSREPEYLRVYLLVGPLQVRVRTVQQADAHGDGADIQKIVVDHPVRFHDFI